MRRAGTLLFLLLAPALGAQVPADSGATRPPQGWRERFRAHREARIREALGLTADQASKLKATHERFAAQRRTLMEDARHVREALRSQLRPGVAANADSVRKLLDAEERGRAALAQLRHDQRRELTTYLSPVQLGQLELMHQARFARFVARWKRMRWRGPGSRDGGKGPDRGPGSL